MNTSPLENQTKTESRRIFILDQDADLAEALAKGLRLYGFTSFSTHLPEQILARIGPHDVLLADYRLPEITGLEVAQKAFAQGWRGPLLLLSGQTEKIKLETIHPLIISILEKPYSTQKLLENLRETSLEKNS